MKIKFLICNEPEIMEILKINKNFIKLLITNLTKYQNLKKKVGQKHLNSKKVILIKEMNIKFQKKILK